jgi:hypothetical protein
MFTPELPGARLMAPVPLDWKTWEMLVSVPATEKQGEIPL